MRDRLALIISITALLVAVFGSTPLGEAAYNAIAPNSIGALELRNGAVTNAKLRGDAVTSGKVLNGSLRGIDFKAGQLPAGPPGPKGDKGDRGDKGTKGDKGDPGTPGLSGYVLVKQVGTVSANGSLLMGATCPTGKKVLGGAARVFQTNGKGIFLNTSTVFESAYNVTAINTTAAPQQVSVEAICAKVIP